jgi:16S rRNA (guanine1207-N2)-methyltransferase
MDETPPPRCLPEANHDDANARNILLQYRRRTGQETLLHAKLNLDIPADVFSSFAVDKGTRLLLREISKADMHWGKVLDLGCGYGPIGLALRASGRARTVTAMDRDALAVAYTRRNARRNDLEDFDALPAMAWPEDLASDFDAIVTNLPAKAGQGVHRHILLGAQGFLRPGGKVWTVVVSSLAEEIEKMLASEPTVDLTRIDGREHSVLHYGFSDRPTLPEDPYLRDVGTFQWGRVRYQLYCLHGLSEFDTRSWVTDAALDIIRNRLGGPGKRHLTVFEPGQGHLPLLAWTKMRSLESIELVSRDCIALGASLRNLGAHTEKIRISGRLSWLWRPARPLEPRRGAAVVFASPKEGYELSLAKLQDLRAHFSGPVVLGCKSAWMQRLEPAFQKEGIEVLARAKRRGVLALLLKGES